MTKQLKKLAALSVVALSVGAVSQPADAALNTATAMKKEMQTLNGRGFGRHFGHSNLAGTLGRGFGRGFGRGGFGGGFGRAGWGSSLGGWWLGPGFWSVGFWNPWYADCNFYLPGRFGPGAFVGRGIVRR